MLYTDLYCCLSYFVKTQICHQIIIISPLNMNCLNQNWHLDTSHLLGKVGLKGQLNITCSSWQSVIELCEIRDGLSSCEAVSNDNVFKLIELT